MLVAGHSHQAQGGHRGLRHVGGRERLRTAEEGALKGIEAKAKHHLILGQFIDIDGHQLRGVPAEVLGNAVADLANRDGIFAATVNAGPGDIGQERFRGAGRLPDAAEDAPTEQIRARRHR